MKRKFWRISSVILTLALLAPLGVFTSSVPAAATTPKPLEGKTISILGDSISTFENYSNGTAADTTNDTIRNNLAYYTEANYQGYSLSSVNDTWWMQAADITGAQILVNNSWSASLFSSTRWNESIPAAYVDRCVQLHDNTGDNANTEPDIIAVFMGTNDFHVARRTSDTDSSKVTLGSTVNYDTLYSGGQYRTPSNTAEAYAIMLDKITKRYQNAEIYCFTLPEAKAINAGDTPYPEATAADLSALKDFNESLVAVAEHYGAYVVDLYNKGGMTSAVSNNTNDPSSNTAHLANYVHPNNFGMDAITNCFLSSVYKNSKYMPTDTVVYNVTYKTDKGLFKQGAPTAVLGGSFTLDIFDTAKTKCSDLKITMGGTDITSSCKTEGKISISNVTGDIVISDPDYIDEDHECNFVESRIINLTCTQRGTRVLKCTVCGKEKLGDYIQPEGHKYDGDTDVDCNVCGKKRELEEASTDTDDVTTQANEPEEESSGCGSALSSGIAIVALAALGTCTVLKKKMRK